MIFEKSLRRRIRIQKGEQSFRQTAQFDGKLWMGDLLKREMQADQFAVVQIFIFFMPERTKQIVNVVRHNLVDISGHEHITEAEESKHGTRHGNAPDLIEETV